MPRLSAPHNRCNVPGKNSNIKHGCVLAGIGAGRIVSRGKVTFHLRHVSGAVAFWRRRPNGLELAAPVPDWPADRCEFPHSRRRYRSCRCHTFLLANVALLSSADMPTQSKYVQHRAKVTTGHYGPASSFYLLGFRACRQYCLKLTMGDSFYYNTGRKMRNGIDGRKQPTLRVR